MQNSTEKQIMPFKTTVNWLFTGIWCYLVIGCFDWKIAVFWQIVVYGSCQWQLSLKKHSLKHHTKLLKNTCCKIYLSTVAGYKLEALKANLFSLNWW